MSPLRSLARLRALAPSERRLLARALILLPAYALGVRTRGLARARGWFSGMRPIEGATAEQAARMVAAAARRAPWKGGCLPAALALQRLLAAQGLDSELRFGVRKAGGRLEAHAWLERGGATLIDLAGRGERFDALVPAGGQR